MDCFPSPLSSLESLYFPLFSVIQFFFFLLLFFSITANTRQLTWFLTVSQLSQLNNYSVIDQNPVNVFHQLLIKTARDSRGYGNPIPIGFGNQQCYNIHNLLKTLASFFFFLWTELLCSHMGWNYSFSFLPLLLKISHSLGTIWKWNIRIVWRQKCSILTTLTLVDCNFQPAHHGTLGAEVHKS